MPDIQNNSMRNILEKLAGRLGEIRSGRAFWPCLSLPSEYADALLVPEYILPTADRTRGPVSKLVNTVVAVDGFIKPISSLRPASIHYK